MVDKKASDFVLNWTFVQKVLLAGWGVAEIEVWECRSHAKYKGKLIRLKEFPHWIFLFHFRATVLYRR